MPEMTVDFEVFCDSCKKGLCHNTTVYGSKLYIEPCEKCLENTGNEEYNRGYKDAQLDFNMEVSK